MTSVINKDYSQTVATRPTSNSPRKSLVHSLLKRSLCAPAILVCSAFYTACAATLPPDFTLTLSAVGLVSPTADRVCAGRAIVRLFAGRAVARHQKRRSAADYISDREG